MRDQALDAIYSLFPLAASHCENLLDSLKQNLNLVKGTSLLVVVGDTIALSEFAALQFPSVFGKDGCYKFNASVVYHIVPGEKTRLVNETDAERFKSVKIATDDITNRVVIVSHSDRLSELRAMLQYTDRILICNSSELTDNDLEKLLNTNVGLTYVGPGHERFQETFSDRDVDAFHEPGKHELENHLTQCLQDASETNLYVAVHTSLKIADSLGVRIDEKRVLAEKAAARELDGTYAEKLSAFECLQSGIASKAADVRNEIMDASEDAQLELSLDFSAAKQDGVHQKAIQVVKDLDFKRPKDFRKNSEHTSELVNETLLIESSKRIKIYEDKIIDKATDAYIRATNSVVDDFKISGFAQQIQPVFLYATEKNTLYKRTRSVMVSVSLDRMPLSNRVYRRGLLTSFGGGIGYSIGKSFEKDEALALSETFFHDVVAKATAAGVEKYVAGVGGAGIAAKLAAAAAVTAATGGTGLPIILLTGTGMFAGNWLASSMQKSAELDSHRTAYDKAISASVNAIAPIVRQIVSKGKKHILREAESTFSAFHASFSNAAEQEVELYKEVEEAPAKIVELDHDKRHLNKILKSLTEVEQELVTSEFQQ